MSLETRRYDPSSDQDRFLFDRNFNSSKNLPKSYDSIAKRRTGGTNGVTVREAGSVWNTKDVTPPQDVSKAKPGEILPSLQSKPAIKAPSTQRSMREIHAEHDRKEIARLQTEIAVGMHDNRQDKSPSPFPEPDHTFTPKPSDRETVFFDTNNNNTGNNDNEKNTKQKTDRLKRLLDKYLS